ncbi:hypothetical protein V1264_012777 [Littorina saxatilis]|uniref:Ig-like domain-containing protein n=3 Tax=Littorina saxatilis TaxID=31220 RepID=A0AAN9BY41_9CAEN
MCIALSDKGKAIKYLTVTVKDNKQELKKPEFLKELKDVEVLEGQSVKFRCKVKGYPQPRINWYKDGNLLRSNKSCRIEKFGNRDYILTIDCATMDDDAEYMVLAKNVAGEVRSTAQVIVEPYSENHPWLSKSRSHSISTVNTDSESDRPSSTQLDDSLIYPARSSPFRDSNRSFNTPRSPAPEEEKVDGLVSKVTAARNNVRKEAEGMLAAAEELTALNQHLEDMERHLDNLEGRNSPKSSNPSHDNVDYSALVDEATALQMIEDEKEMGQAAKGVRKMTSNALSVLRAAEEIIEGERKAMESPSSPSPPLSKRDNSAPFPSLTEENNNKSVSLAPELTQSQLTSHSDLNKSVSSGYGTNSMASSAVEDNESVAGSQVSQQEDEFAMYLPSLDDDISGSYREEVSIALSSKKPSGAPFSSSPASSSGSSTLTNSYSSSSSSSAKTVQSSQPTSTPARNSTLDSAVSSSRRPPVSSAVSIDEPDSRLNTMLPDSLASGREAEEEDLVLNFGPKEIDSRTYGRDYEVKPTRQKSVDRKGENEGEGSEHKRWSVSLDSFSPVAQVVNRQPSVEETEEKIYLTAGKMFHLEDRVKELESRVQVEGDQASPRTMAALQDQVAKTAAQVARSEKDVSSIERAVNTLQFSPRSSRGSNSSNSSTPRESIDSGVSSFTPERHERPLPTHMVGQTQEEEVPESRAEYDADSGIELPSVSRLRAMFGSNKKEEDSSEGNFKRESGDTAIHSITARSLSKDQLQKLREAGNTNMTDIIRIRDQPAQSTASVQLRSKPVAAGAGHPDRRSYPQGAASASLSPAQQQQQQKGGPRQNRTPNLPRPAHYQQLDPSKDPVLIYPEEHEEGQNSAASSTPKPTRLRTRSRSPPPRSGTPRPKSAVILTAPSAGLSNHANRPAASRPRAQSSSEASGSQENLATPRIRSGCISARAAFWERRIMQGEATDTNVEEEFPEMVEDSEA